MAREPVAMVRDDDGQPRVVCDDGTYWRLDRTAGWKPVADPIPGSRADEESE